MTSVLASAPPTVGHLLERVREHKQRATLPRADVTVGLFPQQRAFVVDESTFVEADCSRRAGKSHGAAARLLATEQKKPRAPVLYFTTTRKEAKRIMWQPLLELNAKFGLGLEPVESDLVFKREGRARIYLTGCDNQTEIGKMRGSGWGDVIGDEAQLFPAYIKPLVEESLTPALMDFDGAMRLIGTPGPVPTGYFYEAAHSGKWSRHHWTCWDNPHINPRKLLDKALALRGISESDPSIQREFFGRWVYDASALVFRFDASRNTYDELPPMVDVWQHVIGVDLGYDDADAIAILAFNRDSPASYLREEWVGAKQSISDLADRLRTMTETYKPQAIVVDTGGLGKKIAEEVSSRTGLNLQAAEKQRKYEFIELLNDAMKSGRFFAKRSSRFAADSLKVEWDKDKCAGERMVISDRFHSDITDAVLYAFRESLHWLHKATAPTPPAGTAEWEKRITRKLFEHAQREVQKQKSWSAANDWGGDMDDWGAGE